MSIERFRNFFTPTCDCCEKELPAEESFMDAVEAKRRAGWKTSRDTDGEWVDLCPECAKCQRRFDFVIFRRTGNVRKWRVKVSSL